MNFDPDCAFTPVFSDDDIIGIYFESFRAVDVQNFFNKCVLTYCIVIIDDIRQIQVQTGFLAAMVDQLDNHEGRINKNKYTCYFFHILYPELFYYNI